MSYEKRNRDKVARIITVAPIEATYKDGASSITENTKIYNGYLAAPECDRQEHINENWLEIEQSANEMNWQRLFERAISIAEEVS